MNYAVWDDNHDLGATYTLSGISLYHGESYIMLSTTDGSVYLVGDCNTGGNGCANVILTVTVEFYMH